MTKTYRAIGKMRPNTQGKTLNRYGDIDSSTRFYMLKKTTPSSQTTETAQIKHQTE